MNFCAIACAVHANCRHCKMVRLASHSRLALKMVHLPKMKIYEKSQVSFHVYINRSLYVRHMRYASKSAYLRDEFVVWPEINLGSIDACTSVVPIYRLYMLSTIRKKRDTITSTIVLCILYKNIIEYTIWWRGYPLQPRHTQHKRINHLCAFKLDDFLSVWISLVSHNSGVSHYYHS